MVMDSPSPQSVGREFVRQYYTMLHEAPDFLYRFYSHNSSFLHCGIDPPDEEPVPAVGQNEIHKKISSLQFHDCHAKIRQVDSQWSIGGSVVIQVVGELSNNGSPMRRFMQTFVLGQQNPKKYYVHNDIFRYQDEVFVESGNETDVINEAEAEGLDIEGDSHHVTGTQENESVNTYYGEDAEPGQVQVSNGSPLEAELMEAAVSKAEEIAEPQMTMVEESKLTEANDVIVNEEAVAAQPAKEIVEDELLNVEPLKKEYVADEVVEEQRKTVPQELEPVAVAPPKPTWAAMASKNTTAPPAAAAAAASAVTGYSPKPQVAKPDVVKTEGTPATTGLSQRTPRGPRSEAVAQDGYRGTLDSGDDAGRSMQNYPDNQQVFIGNLPRNLADKDLREFFEKFGGVLDLRINRKQTTNNLPNFGFVVFDSPETVQKVLSERPLMFNGKHRVNVEEKKPKEELVARPRSASHLAGKSSAGRGMDSNMVGPRGGGGRQNVAPGGPRNYAKAAVNDEGKPGTR